MTSDRHSGSQSQIYFLLHLYLYFFGNLGEAGGGGYFHYEFVLLSCLWDNVCYIAFVMAFRNIVERIFKTRSAFSPEKTLLASIWKLKLAWSRSFSWSGLCSLCMSLTSKWSVFLGSRVALGDFENQSFYFCLLKTL